MTLIISNTNGDVVILSDALSLFISEMSGGDCGYVYNSTDIDNRLPKEISSSDCQ